MSFHVNLGEGIGLVHGEAPEVWVTKLAEECSECSDRRKQLLKQEGSLSKLMIVQLILQIELDDVGGDTVLPEGSVVSFWRAVFQTKSH